MKGSRKRCSKGKSCGASCIAKSKTCRVDLASSNSGDLERLAGRLREPVTQSRPAPETKGREFSFNRGNLTVGREVFTPGATLPGSTSPTLYVDSQGKGQWVVKEGGAKGQNVVEKASNDVYGILGKSLGTGAVDSNLVDGKLVNRYISDGKTLDKVSQGDRERLGINNALRKSHIADALVANWDYMGLAGGDNVMVDSRGKVARIDAGGTFNFRAQGANKIYGPIPSEMWSLREGQGKSLWNAAKDSDYRHLWVDQVGALRKNARALKGAVDSSEMDSGAKRAFSQRMVTLMVAGNALSTVKVGGKSIGTLAEEGKISWKSIDSAMKKAFDGASGLDFNGRGWQASFSRLVRQSLTEAAAEA